MTLIRLSRYKEMLDSGIITIDEFNSKKKDLLS
ncbi:MAG: SHOCT domain-containing protein [Ruminococcaceae bacterium]|nr:SHOCT domain-containing protein [Oscillospiraceae bacterium]